MKKIKTVLAAITATAAVAGGIALAGPASAATIQHNCGASAQMCVFYNSSGYGYGAEYGNSTDVYSFNPAYNGGNTYAFKAGAHGSAGQGHTVWNAAAAGSNWNSVTNFAVFPNHGYSGTGDIVPAGYFQDLAGTHNNDTSMAWL